MVHIPYLQPFIDVNKRVSRPGANIPLIRHNLCPLSFIDVPERAYVEGTLGVYELTNIDLLRDVFVWAYERSCQRYIAIRATAAEPDPTRCGCAIAKRSSAWWRRSCAACKRPMRVPSVVWRHRWCHRRICIVSLRWRWMICAICTRGVLRVSGCGCLSIGGGGK